jgi:hypothetical protein
MLGPRKLDPAQCLRADFGQLRALNEYRRPRDPILRLADVKKMIPIGEGREPGPEREIPDYPGRDQLSGAMPQKLQNLVAMRIAPWLGRLVF